MIMNIQTIQHKFSKAAAEYDKYALIQKRFGTRLLAEVKKDAISAQRILDIGTGTGELLRGLREMYPNASITGLDIAAGMLQCLKGKKIASNLIQADAAALPFKEQTFDVIVSNFALQWVFDFENVLRDAYRILQPGGRFYFTTFGPKTFQELKTIFPALDERLRLQEADAVCQTLVNAGFRVERSSVHLEKAVYPSMVEIIKWLKNIGANYTGYIPTKSLGMRKVWQEKEEYYRQNFSTQDGVFATFEAIMINARKI